MGSMKLRCAHTYPGGADVDVTEVNLDTYIDAVVDATLGSGIEAQLTAFREGHNEVRAVSTWRGGGQDVGHSVLAASKRFCQRAILPESTYMMKATIPYATCG